MLDCRVRLGPQIIHNLSTPNGILVTAFVPEQLLVLFWTTSLAARVVRWDAIICDYNLRNEAVVVQQQEHHCPHTLGRPAALDSYLLVPEHKETGPSIAARVAEKHFWGIQEWNEKKTKRIEVWGRYWKRSERGCSYCCRDLTNIWRCWRITRSV